MEEYIQKYLKAINHVAEKQIGFKKYTEGYRMSWKE
jgi:hypothetical protein